MGVHVGVVNVALFFYSMKPRLPFSSLVGDLFYIAPVYLDYFFIQNHIDLSENLS